MECNAEFAVDHTRHPGMFVKHGTRTSLNIHISWNEHMPFTGGLTHRYCTTLITDNRQRLTTVGAGGQARGLVTWYWISAVDNRGTQRELHEG